MMKRDPQHLPGGGVIARGLAPCAGETTIVEIFIDFGQRQECNLQSREVVRCDLCLPLQVQSSFPRVTADNRHHFQTLMGVRGGLQAGEPFMLGSARLSFVKSFATSHYPQSQSDL